MYASHKPELAPEFVDAIESVAELSTPAVVDELVKTIGVNVTALVGDVTEARYVSAWQDASREPQREENLRAALQVVRVITKGAGPATAQRWFLGQNPYLDFDAPVDVLRKNTPEVRAEVLRAAIGFIFR